MLDKHCRISFPVIRIRKKFLKPSPADKLIDKRNLLLRKNPDMILEEVKELNVKIASIIALEQRMKCHKIKKFSDQSGSKNMAEMWKIKKRLWPTKPSSFPAAKINHQG